MATSFYRRPLPDGLVSFASDEGRALFRDALAAGTMEGWFALAEQLHTQSDPAFCGLGTLVVVLDALAIDPGRTWKGPWRWYSEELLSCCKPLEEVAREGLTMGEVACLARCNGAAPTLRRADVQDLEALRADVAAASRSASGPYLIAAYARNELGQTGAGHYSPVGGWHEGRDLALVLDVARFKYPPHWVPLARLHHAMRATDAATGRARGWLVVGRGDPANTWAPSPGCCAG